MRAPTDGEAFSATEEEFFRAGDALGNTVVVEDAADEDDASPRRRAWSRWFARTNRPATEPSIVENDNSGTPVS